MLERFTWIKQSGFRWSGDGMTVYIDPWDVPEDFEPADVVFITHAHDDHYSRDDLARVGKDDTVFVAPRDVASELSGDVTAVGPGDTVDVRGIKGQAVPAYNIRPERLQMHPKENDWVGYVLELDGNVYYHAGDTDHLPELEAIRSDVAFVPIGGKFCCGVDEAVGLVKAMTPDLAVPMHYGFNEGVGVARDGERFREDADPVKVEVLTPVVPFNFE
ncbi:MAG TPA: MBL fold metallo-hydrolase [Actinomycetota bacterium]|jgi:L-ascorbate metabolism protein UlaG (beta-lactamase superfamily)|nr:MBL fold metallo-hydrolase [Actinomycetota bacterium]